MMFSVLPSALEHKCFVVAELSANHNISLDMALQIVRAASDAGADAIKLQTYTPDSITLNLPAQKGFFIDNPSSIWAGRTTYELYKEASLPYEWHAPIFAAAQALGLVCFSTPFDVNAVDFLNKLNVPIYKIASAEIVDIPLLKKVAATGKPVIISTGMATLGEIDDAVRTLRENDSGEIVLLKCTSAYPAPPEESNLRTIPHLAQAFGCKVGLSDHTMGSAVAVAAIALGAQVIEKHFTLSRSGSGPDDSFSMEPDEFQQMVEDIRVAEKALGQVCYAPSSAELYSREYRRSLYVVQDIKAGEVFTTENVRSIRPGYGLPPRYLGIVLGRIARQDIAMGTPLRWDII